MAWVVIEQQGQQVLRTELRGPSMTVGRDEANDLRLENRALSRRHAKIEVRGAGIWIRDLGSQNGTFINGERLEGARPINGGDVINLGGKFDLRLEGVEEAKNTTPVLTLTGPEGTHRFAMVGDEIVLGRSPDCDISIGRKSISRRHLKVFLKDNKFFVEDMGSQNGTRVNADKIRGVTEIGPEDEIRVSEYTIKVSYLEQAQEEDAAASGVHRPNRTMLLDRSKLAAAADLGGDFQVQVTNENRLTFSVEGGAAGAAAPGGGAGAPVDWQEGDELPDTTGMPAPAKKPTGQVVRPAMKSAAGAAQPARPSTSTGAAAAAAPLKAAAAAAKVPEARLEIVGPDGRTRTQQLAREVVLVGEDGAEPLSMDGSPFAPVGCILLAPAAGGWLATVIGDRRLLEVGGQTVTFHTCQDGDVLRLGVVSVTYHQG